MSSLSPSAHEPVGRHLPPGSGNGGLVARVKGRHLRSLARTTVVGVAPRRLGAVSPHLDDLALSCGNFLAAHPGSSLATVFAGGPSRVDPLPSWDITCGAFQPGDDVVRIRRQEDLRAAEILGAATRHLVHWDGQYREPDHGYTGPESDALVQQIAADVKVMVQQLDVDAWLIPLGILHPDHRAVALACLEVATALPDVEWLVYEELPYATAFPEHRDEAIGRLQGRGFAVHPGADAGTPRNEEAKRRAVDAYRTQLEALGPGVEEAIATPERIGRLVCRLSDPGTT